MRSNEPLVAQALQDAIEHRQSLARSLLVALSLPLEPGDLGIVNGLKEENLRMIQGYRQLLDRVRMKQIEKRSQGENHAQPISDRV